MTLTSCAETVVAISVKLSMPEIESKKLICYICPENPVLHL